MSDADPKVQWFMRPSEPGAPGVGDYVLVLMCEPTDEDADTWQSPGFVVSVDGVLADRFVVQTATYKMTATHVAHNQIDALELQTPYGQPVGVWMCSKCKRWAGGNKQLATECCQPVKCRTCDAVVKRGYLDCNVCTEAAYEAKRARIFERAAKVFIDDYSGDMVCVEGCDDEYVQRDQLEEWIEEYAIERGCDYTPPRVYATSPVQHVLDCDGAIEHALDDAFEGAREVVTGEAELEAYMLTWSQAHLPESYYEDNTIALVPWPIDHYSGEVFAKLLGIKADEIERWIGALGFDAGVSPHVTGLPGARVFTPHVLKVFRKELKLRGVIT